jgi:hypothetical protein
MATTKHQFGGIPAPSCLAEPVRIAAMPSLTKWQVGKEAYQDWIGEPGVDGPSTLIDMPSLRILTRLPFPL